MRHIINLDVKFKVSVGTCGDTFRLLRAGQLYLINQLVEFNPDNKKHGQSTDRASNSTTDTSLALFSLFNYSRK